MLTASFLRYIELKLGKKYNQKVHIRRVTPVSGGSINLTAKVDTSVGVFFLKTNDTFRYPGMFEKEARGLQVLRETKTIFIPDLILTGEEEGQAFLLLKFIDGRAKNMVFWDTLGTGFASIHKNTNVRFGLNEDNYIGSLDQSNREHNKWTDFFIEERLEKQLQLAVRDGKLNATDEGFFKKLYMNLDSLIPKEQPALLHGDFWNGNLITGPNGEPCIIDPAVYYGHREMDLAMTKLFGGFDQQFYEVYNSAFPLAPGFDDRIDIHNLYPLMVHLNLFGGNYVSQVRTIVKRFS